MKKRARLSFCRFNLGIPIPIWVYYVYTYRFILGSRFQLLLSELVNKIWVIIYSFKRQLVCEAFQSRVIGAPANEAPHTLGNFIRFD